MMGSLAFPALLVGLCFMPSVVRRTSGRRVQGTRGVGASGTEELHALLYPGKRVQLERRRVELVLRGDENDGGPRRSGIDLAAGKAVPRRPPSGAGPPG